MRGDNDIYIDPEVEVILARMRERAEDRGPIGSASPDVMRARFNEDVKAWNVDLPEMRVQDQICPCISEGVPTRLYDPDPDAKLLPTLLFMHGGGWVVGDLNTNERTLRLLSLRSGFRVLSIDYPLAPEHRYPSALETCVAVVEWVAAHGVSWGLDADRLGIGGDSAGGNLALAAALDLRNAGKHLLSYQMLIYPALSPLTDSESYRRFGTGEYGTDGNAMRFFWDSYLNGKQDFGDPRAALLLAEKSMLPPTYLVTAALDALTDDSNQLAEQLASAGTTVVRRHYDGMIHGFFSMSRILEVADRAVSEAADFMRSIQTQEAV